MRDVGKAQPVKGAGTTCEWMGVKAQPLRGEGQARSMGGVKGEV